MRMDVKNGLFSLAMAEKTFGVALEGADFTVNEAKTKELRGL